MKRARRQPARAGTSSSEANGNRSTSTTNGTVASDWTYRVEATREQVGEAVEGHWFSYLLAVLTLSILVAVPSVPSLPDVWMSVTWPVPGDPEWLGPGNYRDHPEKDRLYTAFWAAVLFATTTIVQFGAAIVTAPPVANRSRFDSVVGGTMSILYTKPPIATGSLWLFLLDPTSAPCSTISMRLFADVATGYNYLPLERFAETDVAVTNAGIHTPHIAEQAPGFVLVFARRLHERWRRQQRPSVTRRNTGVASPTSSGETCTDWTWPGRRIREFRPRLGQTEATT